MKWLKRKIRNWLQEELVLESDKIGSTLSTREHDWEEPMRFSLTKANGGYIINCRKFDRKTDRQEGNVYILTDDQDITEEIGKIVSMEMLKL